MLVNLSFERRKVDHISREDCFWNLDDGLVLFSGNRVPMEIKKLPRDRGITIFGITSNTPTRSSDSCLNLVNVASMSNNCLPSRSQTPGSSSLSDTVSASASDWFAS